jgi:hypothetical protein
LASPCCGEADFEHEKAAVHNLRELLNSSISNAQLQQFIQLITNADRQFAQVVINDARAAGGDQQTINRAMSQLGEGDADLAAGKFEEAITDYAAAWRRALTATRGS